MSSQRPGPRLASGCHWVRCGALERAGRGEKASAISIDGLVACVTGNGDVGGGLLVDDAYPSLAVPVEELWLWVRVMRFTMMLV